MWIVSALLRAVGLHNKVCVDDLNVWNNSGVRNSETRLPLIEDKISSEVRVFMSSASVVALKVARCQAERAAPVWHVTLRNCARSQRTQLVCQDKPAWRLQILKGKLEHTRKSLNSAGSRRNNKTYGWLTCLRMENMIVDAICIA